MKKIISLNVIAIICLSVSMGFAETKKAKTESATKNEPATKQEMPKDSIHAGMGGMGNSPHGSAAPTVDLKNIKVAKANGPDSFTVAEVYAKKADLKGKKVNVQGKVVKINHGIKDRNWLHLRDGSGSDTDKNNDLTVTSVGDAKVGDVITVNGSVSTEKDLGMGYFFPVLVEDAQIKK